jgi:soluble lytic murein transglycosylase-like protein
MRIFAIAFALICSAVLQDMRLLPQATVFAFPARATTVMSQRLPRKIVDPTRMIRAAARKHNVSAALVKSIVAAESAFDANAISRCGAMGLMQLMPVIARHYGADPLIPEQNIDAGTRYLAALIEKYAEHPDGLHRAIAAYNAGPAVVDRYQGIPPYKQTREYVERVLAYLEQYVDEQSKLPMSSTSTALRYFSGAFHPV